MRTIRHVLVTCDGCGVCYSYLNSYADEEAVTEAVKAHGWLVKGDKDYCPRCSKDKDLIEGRRVPLWFNGGFPSYRPPEDPLPEDPSDYDLASYLSEWEDLCYRIDNVNNVASKSPDILAAVASNAMLASGMSKMYDAIGKFYEAYYETINAATSPKEESE